MMSTDIFPLIVFNDELWKCERHWSNPCNGSLEVLYCCEKDKSKYVIAAYRWMIEVESQVRGKIAKYYSQTINYIPDHLFDMEE